MSDHQFIIQPAQRVSELPPYIFATTFKMKEEALAAGKKVIDLGVGNPDGRPPHSIIEALITATNDHSWNCHRYGSFKGMPRLREAIAAWYFNRFVVKVDPENETLPLIGSKEGLANLMRAYLNPGDTIILPSPGYPAYFGAARLCQAEIFELPLRQENGFLADFQDIPAAVASRARMLILNYPGNPTGGVCDLEFFQKAVLWCRQHKVMLVSDIAYSELGFDPDNQPPSVLQVPGAMDVAIEFQSLSKSHNLAGWRIGFAVGNAEVIANLGKLKSNVDFSVFGGIQMAAVAALTGNQKICADNRELYRRRRDHMVKGYRALGWQVPEPPATMYIWAKTPTAYGTDDMKFVKELFAQTSVLLAPGSGFGIYGQGYVRTSLVADEDTINILMDRLQSLDINWG